MIEVTGENLDTILKGKKITILQFGASWCGPCKMLSPIMASIRSENEGKDVAIGKVNVDMSSDVGSKYGVRSIPTLIYFKDGVETSRTVGLKSKTEIQETIDGLLN